MNLFHTKTLFAELNSQKLIQGNGRSLVIPFSLWYGDNVLAQISIRQAGLPFDVTGYTFSLGVNHVFQSSPTGLVYCYNSCFISTDLATGQICCRINAKTNPLLAYLGTRSSKAGYMTLWGYPTSQPPLLLFQNQIKLYNRISQV